MAPRRSAGRAEDVLDLIHGGDDLIVPLDNEAEMRGRSISQRAAALTEIAYPPFRDQLTADARALGYL